MTGIIESAANILSLSQQRVEISAHNIANASTPGYKRGISFTDSVDHPPGIAGDISSQRVESFNDLAAGKMISTGNPLDLAIAGSGFFAIRAGEEVLYTRQGQFSRDADGRLVTAQGHVLQAADGGDVVVSGAAFTATAEGLVLEEGRPVAQLGLYDFADPAQLAAAGGSAFRAGGAAEAEPARAAAVRQGMLESSNVSTGAEMVAMMEALRRAESGQRLVSTWDELMGRALTTFGGR